MSWKVWQLHMTREKKEQWLLPGGRKIHDVFENFYLMSFKRIVMGFYFPSFPSLQCIHVLAFLINAITN